MGKLDLNNFKEPDKETPLNKLCTEIYEFGEKLIFRLSVHENNPLEVISGCLVMKMLNAYKATYLFINTEYFLAEAHVLLRYLYITHIPDHSGHLFRIWPLMGGHGESLSPRTTHSDVLPVIETDTHADNSARYYWKYSLLGVKYVPYKTY